MEKVNAMFDRLDTSGDGHINIDEFSTGAQVGAPRTFRSPRLHFLAVHRNHRSDAF